MRNVEKICDRLVKCGQKMFKDSKTFIKFSNNHEANILLNDLSNHPHAFLLACLMDRQIKAEKAWLIPHLIREKIGNFSIESLGKLSLVKITDILSRPEPLHRFVKDMSNILFKAIHRIIEQYNGDASLIWKGNLPSAEVVYRILEFEVPVLKLQVWLSIYSLQALKYPCLTTVPSIFQRMFM